MTIAKDIGDYLSSYLDPSIVTKYSYPKMFRDGLGSLMKFDPFEVSIIDSPLIQRLRYIHQTGLTYFVYPSANHNRFEHSLGVTHIVGDICRSLQEKKGMEKTITTDNKTELRLAALLHDVGHGPFSHASETIMKQLPEVQAELKKESFSSSKPHEMISYYITKADSMQEFLRSVLDSYGDPTRTDRIPNMIIGAMEEKAQYGYLGDIINGPFDADKLDYILRDAHSTGIQMSYDFERFLHSISVDMRPGEEKRIISNLSGAHILEQLLFCKMFLFPSVYHHHKVRASECMIQSVFEKMFEEKITICDLSFRKVTDFLKFTDNRFLNEAVKVESLRPQVENLLQRRLLMRCLVINRHTIEEESEPNLAKMIGLRRDSDIDAKKILTEIRKEISERVSKNGDTVEYYDIWLDLPDFPRFNEPFNQLIKMTEDIYQVMNDIFPVSPWAMSFAQFKWKGHLFGPLKYQKEIAVAGEKVIEEYLGIKLNSSASKLANHRPRD